LIRNRVVSGGHGISRAAGQPWSAINIPTGAVRPGRNLAVIVEVAAINFRQKQMGYNAAKALTERVFGVKS